MESLEKQVVELEEELKVMKQVIDSLRAEIELVSSQLSVLNQKTTSDN